MSKHDLTLHIRSQIMVICFRVKTGFSVAGRRCIASLASIMNSEADADVDVDGARDDEDDGDIGGDGE